MENKHGKYILLFSMAFVILILVLVVVVFFQKEKIARRVSEQNAILNDNVEESIAEQNAAEIGLMKMIAGNIVSIDKDGQAIEIDVDPYGTNKKYRIYVNSQTSFFEKKDNQEAENCESEEECSSAESVPTFFVSSLENLQDGQLVEVYFAKRIDVDTAERLDAVKVVGLQS